MSIEIHQVLVLSTGHLPRWAAEGMENTPMRSSPADERLRGLSFDNLTYGYLVYVGGAGDQNVPEELAPAWTFAHKHDIEWIKFDGPEVEGLPTWEW